jgi:hypothetical protein
MFVKVVGFGTHFGAEEVEILGEIFTLLDIQVFFFQ